MKRKLARAGVAYDLGKKLGVDFRKIPLEQLRRGLIVEHEHDDLTKGDPLKTAKIALAHLREHRFYYDMLDEAEAKMRRRR